MITPSKEKIIEIAEKAVVVDHALEEIHIRLTPVEACQTDAIEIRNDGVAQELVIPPVFTRVIKKRLCQEEGK